MRTTGTVDMETYNKELDDNRKEYHENLSVKEVEELTQKFIEHPDPIARFYIIMSHGTQTELMDRYSMWFDYNSAILSKFTSANAQHLQDVQKCVVINTNRYCIIPKIVRTLLQHDPEYKARKLPLNSRYNFINFMQTSCI